MDEGKPTTLSSRDAHSLTEAKALYVGQILYIFSMGLSRCSTAFFLRNLSTAKRHGYAGFAMAGSAMSWAIASIVTIAVRGDLSAPWEDRKVVVRLRNRSQLVNTELNI